MEQNEHKSLSEFIPRSDSDEGISEATQRLLRPLQGLAMTGEEVSSNDFSCGI